MRSYKVIVPLQSRQFQFLTTWFQLFHFDFVCVELNIKIIYPQLSMDKQHGTRIEQRGHGHRTLIKLYTVCVLIKSYSTKL
jgi:hypothetical protein